MCPRCVGSFLRMVAATAFLAACPLLAWAQGERADRRETLAGNWCSKNEGCGHWDTHYAVTIEGEAEDSIRIKYRDTEFTFFEGRIHRRPIVKWTIMGSVAGIGSVTGITTGDSRSDIEKASHLTIDGTLTRKRSAESAKTVSFRGEITREKLEGTIKGFITGTVRETGENVEGAFEGAFQESVKEWRIHGIYTPPPAECSFAGRRQKSLGRWRSELGRARSSLGRWRTDAQKEAKKARRENRAESERLEVKAGKIARAEPRLGRFSRAVEGTMSHAKDEITIQLPHRPVLTDKCRVEDIIPAGKLELVKQ